MFFFGSSRGFTRICMDGRAFSRLFYGVFMVFSSLRRAHGVIALQAPCRPGEEQGRAARAKAADHAGP